MADYAFADPHATATALFCNLLLVGSRGLAATEALNRNGAANSAVLVHQTRGIGPLRLALAGATRSGSAGVGALSRSAHDVTLHRGGVNKI